MSQQRYLSRGVSASKEEVHQAISHIDKGLYPKAFCKIVPDILGGDPDYCNLMHATEQEPNHPGLCLLEKKPGICRFGKALRRMHSL
jgi:hypothetical protein